MFTFAYSFSTTRQPPKTNLKLYTLTPLASVWIIFLLFLMSSSFRWIRLSYLPSIRLSLTFALNSQPTNFSLYFTITPQIESNRVIQPNNQKKARKLVAINSTNTDICQSNAKNLDRVLSASISRDLFYTHTTKITQA